MAFSSAATTELTKVDKVYACNVQAKNRLDASSYTDITWISGEVSYRDGLPATCTLAVPNTSFQYSDETDTTNRLILGGSIKVTATVGSETKVLFEGDIDEVTPENQYFSIKASDPRQELNRRYVRTFIEPDKVEIIAEGSARAIAEIQAQQPYVYGFSYTGGGDVAFNDAGTARRSWVRTGLTMWETASMVVDPDPDVDEQVSGGKFNIDWTSGAVQIHIPESELQTNYYLSNVFAYKESLASGASNVDYARLLEAAILYEEGKGGYGGTLGTEWGNAVVAVTAVSKQISIAGDYTRFYTDNSQIYLQGNTGLTTATLTINGTPSYTGGNTVITVDQTITGITADGYISLDTGIDIDRAFNFRGKVSDLIKKIEQEQQSNLRIHWYADNGKFWFQPTAQASSTEWDLIHPQSIGQPRNLVDLKTCLVGKGQAGLAINDVHTADADGLLYDIVSGTPNWFKWDGVNVYADDTFANVIPNIYDADANISALAHNLNGTADIDAGSDQYTGWYYLIYMDFGETKNIDRIRVHMPGSRHPEQQLRVKDGTQLWPGIRVQLSDNTTNGTDGDWFDISVDLNGRYEPSKVIDVDNERMSKDSGRYLRVLCGAYKQGFENLADPAIGLAELEVFTNIDYEIERKISYPHPIVTADATSNYFEVEGDYVSEWAVGDTFTVIESAGNNGNYTVTAVSLQGSNTRISVASVASGTADGRLYTTTNYEYIVGTGSSVQRHYVNLYDRFGGFLVQEVDFGTQYSEAVAADVLTQRFSEQIRMFQQVKYKSVCDPRIDLYSTVGAADSFNGDVTSIFVEEVRINLVTGGSTVVGTDYLAGVLN